VNVDNNIQNISSNNLSYRNEPNHPNNTNSSSFQTPPFTPSQSNTTLKSSNNNLSYVTPSYLKRSPIEPTYTMNSNLDTVSSNKTSSRRNFDTPILNNYLQGGNQIQNEKDVGKFLSSSLINMKEKDQQTTQKKLQYN
jgi:hypothetical protein